MSYVSDAGKRSAREERAEQIAKMSKMSAFLRPADSAPPPMKLIKKTISGVPCQRSCWATWQCCQQKTNIPESLTFQIWWIFLRKKRHASE